MTIRTVYITINNRPNLIAYPPFISSFGRVPFSSSYLILYSFLFSFVSSAVYVALSSLFFSVCVEWVDIYKNGGRMLLWSLLHDGRFGGSWGCCMAAVDYIQPGGCAAIVSAALLSRLFQLSTLSELTAPRSFTQGKSLRVSVLYSPRFIPADLYLLIVLRFIWLLACWIVCKSFLVEFRIYNISHSLDYTWKTSDTRVSPW